MSTVKTVEYFNTCPSCGAANDGSEICAYCGGTLVNRRIIEEVAEPLQATFRREDMHLPVIKGKNGSVSGFMKVFCGLFGGIFLGVSTVLFCTFAGVGFLEWWLIPFFGLFWTIGLGAFIPLIRASAANKRCESNPTIRGQVRGYANSSVSINGSPAKNIRLRIEDGSPRIVELNTMETSEPYPIGSFVNLRTDGTYYLM